MAKRRKISEINKDMDELNNKKPSAEKIEELAEIINEKEESNIKDENDPMKKIASDMPSDFDSYIRTQETNAIESTRI